MRIVLVLAVLLWVGCSNPDPYTSQQLGKSCADGCPSYLKCDQGLGTCQPPCTSQTNEHGATEEVCLVSGWGCSKNNKTCRKSCDEKCPEGTRCWPASGGQTKCTKEP